MHTLSEQATESYEQGRKTVGRFIKSADAREIIFVLGATEGINLVAQTWGRANIGRGDEIVVSAMEHHSNIVPWQILCEEKGAKLRVIPVNDAGELMLDEFEKSASALQKALDAVGYEGWGISEQPGEQSKDGAEMKDLSARMDKAFAS